MLHRSKAEIEYLAVLCTAGAASHKFIHDGRIIQLIAVNGQPRLKHLFCPACHRIWDGHAVPAGCTRYGGLVNRRLFCDTASLPLDLRLARLRTFRYDGTIRILICVMNFRRTVSHMGDAAGHVTGIHLVEVAVDGRIQTRGFTHTGVQHIRHTPPQRLAMLSTRAACFLSGLIIPMIIGIDAHSLFIAKLTGW